ncbi:hypothetical protein GCM10027217_03190 [Pseudomaricurvus hydrocarbonicus]
MNRTALASQRGVGLIEVLIAILVIAIGILGSISLQLSSKRLGHEAVQRTLAANLAQDLMERMRSNPSELTSYVMSWKSGDAALTATKDCATNSCTTAELVAHDQAQWVNELQGVSETRVLIVGDAAVQTGGVQQPSVCVTNTNGYVTVAIAWRGYQALSDPGLSTCGDDTGLYGANNEYRQVLSLSSYIKEL